MLSQLASPRTLRVVDPITSPEWAALVAGNASTLFHSPEWMRVVQETYNLPVCASIIEEEGRPIAGVPWNQVDDALGSRRVTLAFSDFCDPLAPSPAEANSLAESIVRDGKPWTLRTLVRNLPTVGAPTVQQTHFKWQGIDLTSDTETLWQRLRASAQRNVRLALRSGLTVREAVDKSQLREWYLLHLRLRRAKYGLLAQPYAFFETIWDRFVEKGAGFLLLAMYQDRPVGGVLFLLWKDACYYKFNASSHEYLHLRPNDLTMWHGMLAAKERGCTFLNLGRSSVRQEGLIRFKRCFGVTSDEDLCSVTYAPHPGDFERTNQIRHLLQDLTGLFVKDTVPDPVAEQAGSLLYRFFT